MQTKLTMIGVALLAGAAAFGGTSTWTQEPKGAWYNWFDPGNWDVPPAEDGSSDASFVCDQTGSAGTLVNVNGAAAVHSLSIKQGKATGGRVTFQDTLNGELAIGTGGVTLTNFTGGDWSGSLDGAYAPVFNVPVRFAASQDWSFCFNKSSDASTSYDLTFGNDWTSANDVEVAFGGPANRLAFTGGSSSGFAGSVKLGLTAYFKGADQFSRLGTNRVTIANTPTTGWPARDRYLVFHFTDTSVGYFDTPINFGFTDADALSTKFFANMIESEFDTELHIRGAWSGKVRSDKLVVEGPGDLYSSGFQVSSIYEGQFRPEQNMIFFENDMTDLDLTCLSTVSWHFQPSAGFVVIANPKAEKWVSSGKRLYGAGRGSRLRGMLAGDGVRMNRENKSYYCVYVGTPGTGEAGGPILVGAGTAGSCSYGRLEMRLAETSAFAETPVWFYSVEGGTALYDNEFVSDGSGAARALPVQVWGRGDTVLSFTYANFGDAPIWVRGGRLRISKQTAAPANKQVLRVGAPVAGRQKVRAMHVNRFSSGVASHTTDVITFAAGKMPTPDGVTLATGDKVCVNIPDKDYDTVGSVNVYYNGIYTVDTEANTWTRTADFDEPAELVPDIRLDVAEGAKFGGRRYFLLNEGYRIAQRRGGAPYPGFEAIGFIEEITPNPSCSLLTEGAVTLGNRVVITQNESTNRCEVGGNTAAASGFSGAFEIGRDFTVSAVAGGTCTFSGPFTGSAGLTKSGAGTVVLSAATVNEGAFSVTNLTIEAGRLQLPSAALAPSVRTAQFAYAENGSATLGLSGDVDLSEWTFDVSGLFKPAKGAEVPGKFLIAVESADGTVSGTPAFRLSGTDTANWSVMPTAEPNVWAVRYTKPGLMLIFR